MMALNYADQAWSFSKITMLALHYTDNARLIPTYILDPPLLDPKDEIPMEIRPTVQKLHL
jgi:hypothetical protein